MTPTKASHDRDPREWKTNVHAHWYVQSYSRVPCNDLQSGEISKHTLVRKFVPYLIYCSPDMSIGFQSFLVPVFEGGGVVTRPDRVQKNEMGSAVPIVVWRWFVP